MAEAKLIVLEGLESAANAARSANATLGALFDEEIGSEAIRRTREKGLALAICAEKSSQAEFDFEYGDRFAEHIEAINPDFVKILARYNVEGDAAANRGQAERLVRLSDWLAGRDNRLLFELIVPAEPGQLASVGGDAVRFRAERRPRLVALAIAELKDAGVEPTIWKVEGVDSAEDCRLIAETARADGRDHVRCVVLGAGADQVTVTRWLELASQTEGFAGFAIGRTIFWEPLTAWNGGQVGRETRVDAIAQNYRRMIDAYELHGREPART
jgi:myo-inositol catabolism protein IolC